VTKRLILVLLVLTMSLGVAGAQAEEIPNTVYLGPHSGGGTVEFHVTASGTAVDFIELTDLPGGCLNLLVWPNLPIVNHAFALEERDGVSFFRGAFGPGDTASGTLRWANACDTGVVTWTATVAVPPPPIPPAPPSPPRCHVQNVVGKTLATAKRLIVRRGCKTGRITRAYSTRTKKGRVLSQRPKGGRIFHDAVKVNLVVGRGPRR
jgi:hypothetical protein